MLMSYPSLAQLESHARRRSSQLIASISPRFRWFILTLLLLPALFLALIKINSTSAQALLSFGAPTPYNAGAGPYWTATFTKFGKPAIAVTNQDGNSVSVLYGNMVGGQFNGTFGPATTYDLVVASVATPAPQQVVAGNLGQLPLPCLVIAAAGANRVAVLLGDSDDTFQPTPVYYNVGNFPESVALGDVNGDGNLDIIAANFGSSTISVLLGNSDRTFQTQQTYPTSPSPESVVVADFNNDGKTDVATVNSGSTGKVNVLLNVNGTFPNALTSDVGPNPFSLAVGDFNSDGKLDIVTANHSGGVSVLLNNGVRPFPTAAPAPINAGSAPLSVAVADFNLDGQPDIAVSNSDNGGSVGILPNNNGSFQALQASDRFSSGPNPQFIASGDFNTDGKPDVVVPNHPSPAVNPGTINVLLNTATPFVLPPPNDNFASATTLSQTVSGRVTGSNDGATHELNEPQHAGKPGVHSVWYTWTAPATGGATFDTFASTFDTVLGVYVGPGFGALTRVASGNNDLGDKGEPRLTSRIKFNAVAGTTYSIAVDSGSSTTGNIILNWSLLPPPANDNFNKAEVLPSAATGSINGTNLGASKEVGENNHAGSVGGASVWYRWSPTVDGDYTFKTSGSIINGGPENGGERYDTLLAIYTGSSVNNLTPIPCGNNTQCPSNDDESTGVLTSRVTFTASHNVTYYIAVDSKGGDKSNLILSWTPAADVGPGVLNGDSGSRSDLMNADSLTYSWKPTKTGVATFTCNSFKNADFSDSRCHLSVSGAGGTETPGTCQFSPLICQPTTLQFNTISGSTYGITVSRPAGATGSANFSWNISTLPPNDNFANAELISGFVGFTPLTTVGATSEPGEPLSQSGSAASGVWYTWNPPADFNVALSVQRPNPPFLRIDVYTGSSFTEPLIRVGGGIENATLNVAKNKTYHIRVEGAPATGSLRWSPNNPPPNDNFAFRQTLVGASGSVNATNSRATKEAGERNHAGNSGGASVWFSWTPQTSAVTTFTTDRTDFDTLLAVYAGSDLGTLSEVVSNDNESVGSSSSNATFYAIAGTTYQIAVDGASFSTGNIILSWGSPRSISGRVTDIRGVGIANIQVQLSVDSSLRRVTDASGRYSFPNLLQGRTYTVTPARNVFTFDQTTQTYAPLTTDVPDANFVAKTPTYSIAGKIKVNGVGIDNIPVTLIGTNIPPGETVLTTAGGNYSFTELTTNGDYKVTPSSPIYTFSADILPVNNFYEYKTLNEDKKGADFTATALPQTLTVASQNPTSGVVITITPVDNGSLGGGPTPLTRVYNPGTQVTLTASPAAGGNNFQKWLKDGVDFSTNTSTSVTMDANHTMTAVYLTPTRTLTVASSNPASGINITVTPSDKNNQGNGVTQFTRTYNINQKVTLTAPATNGNNSFQKWLKDGADFSTDPSTDVTLDADHTMTAVYLTTSAQTPAGQNVPVQLNGVTVTFSNVTTAGSTTIKPISPAEAGQLPNGFQLTGDSIAFDISTTAVVQPPISVCFNVPSVTDATAFGHLRILHSENGTLEDRTTSQNFATKTICATVSSLSPFVLASATVQQLELLLEDSATPTMQVTALDALLMLRDPFPVVSPGNLLLGADKNTRVVVLVRNLLPGTTATVHLVDANGQVFNLPAIDQRPLSDFEFSQVVFRLPDTLAAGPCAIEIRASGLVSNLGTIRIK